MVMHVIPKTLEEALDALADGQKEIIAGGTDLMVQRRKGAGRLPEFSRGLVYLFALDTLKYVRVTADDIHIGAMTPQEVLLTHPLIPDLLKNIIGEMASPALRRVATLAGNIANASPAGDSLGYLYLADARVKLKSVHGERVLSMSEIITGPKKTVIEPHEAIIEIIIPNHRFTHETWKKVGTRRADALSKASFVAAAVVDDDTIRDFRVAFGAVSATVVRRRDIEQSLFGKSVSFVKHNRQGILEQYLAHIQPIDDQRSNIKYRKAVSKNLLLDFIESL